MQYKLYVCVPWLQEQFFWYCRLWCSFSFLWLHLQQFWAFSCTQRWRLFSPGGTVRSWGDARHTEGAHLRHSNGANGAVVPRIVMKVLFILITSTFPTRSSILGTGFPFWCFSVGGDWPSQPFSSRLFRYNKAFSPDYTKSPSKYYYAASLRSKAMRNKHSEAQLRTHTVILNHCEVLVLYCTAHLWWSDTEENQGEVINSRQDKTNLTG